MSDNDNHSASALPPIRRVLTGDDAQGQSSIVQDGPSPAVRLVPERPGYRVTNLWRTGAAPSDVAAPDSIAEHKGVQPPPGGTSSSQPGSPSPSGCRPKWRW